MALRDLHPLKGEKGFTWRGGDPTRVEALSDMVFAFALTLLVVSANPPSTFEELSVQLWGFPGFAGAFLLLLLVWNQHYTFFRRYALEDGWTSTLNAGLLFIILFFVYPLKYQATMLSQFIFSMTTGAPRAPFTLEEARASLIILSSAYAAVFFMFAALYGHALSKADALELDVRERQLSLFSYWQQIIHVCVGLSVVAAASLTPMPWAPMTGFLYFFIGPLIMIAGLLTMREPKKRKLPAA